jgi:hypothetical protein
MRDGFEIVHAIDLAKSSLGYHTLLVYYNESDPLGAVGSILCAEHPVEGRRRLCLAANCQLNALWVSPAGNLWAVDDHGDVFTVAEVRMPAPPYRNLDFNSGSYSLSWHVGQVFHGQLNGIWGSADDDVWVTSFAGTALHFNGETWTPHELFRGPNAIKGQSPDDIYVVGYDGNIHHWDGTQWSKLPVPNGVDPTDVFTDVAFTGDGRVLITARSGTLLIGSARDGFIDVGNGAYNWYGVGCFEGRIFLAGGEKGIFEYTDNRFICLKDKGHPVGVIEGSDAINFIPAEQKPEPWFVRYEPRAEREWSKVNT